LYVLASATWPAINHNSFNASLLALALFFSIQALQKRSTPHLAVSGLLTGLATLVIQHKGAAMLVAVAGANGMLGRGKPSLNGQWAGMAN
jgi:hypothetical protein